MSFASADGRITAPDHDLIAEIMQAGGSWKGIGALECGQLELRLEKVT